MRLKKSIIFVFCTLFLWITLSSTALAIPAFARRYKLSCSTCHMPFPRLKDYGDDYAGNGFVLEEEESERDYISAGDDILWLQRDFPVAVRFDAYALYDDDKVVENDLQSPWGLKLMTGGSVFKNVGYYLYFYMSERGEVAGIEDAYLHFNNLFDSNLDIMVGQFQTSDPLMKRELRLTFEDYNIYKTKIAGSNTDLAYDRGVMVVYGIDQTSTDITGMVVNGNGKAEAGADKSFDQDNYKNIGFRVSQAVGDLFSIGGFYYQGKETLQGSRMIDGDTEITFSYDNELSYWGPDINIGVGPIDITGQYLLRKDTHKFSDRADEEIETSGIVLEAVFAPHLDRSRYYLTALYNNIDSDWDVYDYETATLSATYLFARNIRFILEYSRDLQYDSNRFLFGMVSGF
jgi:hypothetical protein